MLGTFNPDLPMILSNNYTDVRGSPHFYLIVVWELLPISVQQSVKYVLFTNLDLIMKHTEMLSCQCYLQKLTMVLHHSTDILFTKNITIQRTFDPW